jgi:saccharolysin
MLENWILNKDILKKVSKHYKTGQPLPDDLITMKVNTKNEYAATETLSQIFLGTVDFLLYSASDQKLLNATASHAQVANKTSMLEDMRSQLKHKDGFMIDTEELWHTAAKTIEHDDYQIGTNPIGTFGHLITGYVS